ncbi:hypothetical protein RCL_jg6868.t1 [Rhizophagus clarus]|uniref:Uncharacterized protein n=1 Tax=Rhizophagus clarus TaxID=94130 RepID=A0A8H3LBS9_9GLOM|nr:hypothetical protein RCL_jg6868.t1 [Rhizophagus clarus]
MANLLEICLSEISFTNFYIKILSILNSVMQQSDVSESDYERYVIHSSLKKTIDYVNNIQHASQSSTEDELANEIKKKDTIKLINFLRK